MNSETMALVHEFKNSYSQLKTADGQGKTVLVKVILIVVERRLWQFDLMKDFEIKAALEDDDLLKEDGRNKLFNCTANMGGTFHVS